MDYRKSENIRNSCTRSRTSRCCGLRDFSGRTESRGDCDDQRRRLPAFAGPTWPSAKGNLAHLRQYIEQQSPWYPPICPQIRYHFTRLRRINRRNYRVKSFLKRLSIGLLNKVILCRGFIRALFSPVLSCSSPAKSYALTTVIHTFTSLATLGQPGFEDARGYLPRRSDVKALEVSENKPPFLEHIACIDRQIMPVATGGLLMMLTESETGTLTSRSHSDTFLKTARTNAALLIGIRAKSISSVKKKIRQIGCWNPEATLTALQVVLT